MYTARTVFYRYTGFITKNCDQLKISNASTDNTVGVGIQKMNQYIPTRSIIIGG